MSDDLRACAVLVEFLLQHALASSTANAGGLSHLGRRLRAVMDGNDPTLLAHDDSARQAREAFQVLHEALTADAPEVSTFSTCVESGPR
jgi:hypothetical protein